MEPEAARGGSLRDLDRTTRLSLIPMSAPPPGPSRQEGRRLPRGRHDLPGQVVRNHQRKRLIAAMAERCANGGYATSSVSEIVGTATVSKRTFYEIFESKEECLLAAYDDYRSRLFESIEAACDEGGEWPARVRSATRAVLGFFAEDLAGAQLLCTAVLCATPEGLDRHYETIDAIAERIRGSAPHLRADFPNAEWGAVVSMSAGVSRAAAGGERGAILALEEDFARTVLYLTEAAA